MTEFALAIVAAVSVLLALMCVLVFITTGDGLALFGSLACPWVHVATFLKYDNPLWEDDE